MPDTVALTVLNYYCVEMIVHLSTLIREASDGHGGRHPQLVNLRTAEYSALNGTTVSHPILPQCRDHQGRGAEDFKGQRQQNWQA